MGEHVATLLYTPLVLTLFCFADQQARVFAAERIASAAAYRAALAVVSAPEGASSAEREVRARDAAAVVLLVDARGGGAGSSDPVARAVRAEADRLGLDLPGLDAARHRTEVVVRAAGDVVEVTVRWRHPLRTDPAAPLLGETHDDDGWSTTVVGHARVATPT